MSSRTLKILELAKQARINAQRTDEVVAEPQDFDSDDYVKDPDFEISEHTEQDISSEEDDHEMIELGEQIEQNLGETELPNVSQIESTGSNHYSRKKAKENRNKGASYINKKGSFIQERKFTELINYICRKRCKDKIPYNMQRELFQTYWSLGSYNQRILYISSLMNIVPTKTTRNEKNIPKSRNRPYHIKYSLEYKSERIEVCQKCFRSCFNETESFLKSVMKKKLEYPDLEIVDYRGSGSGINRCDENVIKSVKDHIESFPAYESHYTRRDTSCKYLHASLTLTQMHKMYCEKNHKVVSLSKYSEIFKTMNIKFKKPKIDTCNKCDLLKAKIDASKIENNNELQIDLENQLKKHHAEADGAYESKRKDKSIAAANSTVGIYTFDLQKCLPTPFLQTNIAFYKRQLWTFNLTVHDCVTNVPYCYMWHEAIAGRGGNQIASCLFKHVMNLTTNSQVKNLVFYSDSCPGQNRNSFMCAMFSTAVQCNKNLETIDQKFLEPGHTHMECDVDHAMIERKKKKTDAKIHHPRDWYNFVRDISSKTKFNVIEMEGNDFLNFSLYLKEKFMFRSRNELGEPFVWKNVRWLRFSKTNFGKIFYKTSLSQEEPFKVLNLIKRGISSVSVEHIPIIEEEIKISAKKKKDLEDLLQFIDPSFHLFYKSLKTHDVPDIHPDLITDTEEM